MTSDACLLNDIYQNARMGIQSIPQLIEMTDDQKFREVLKDQMAEYQTIASTAEIMLAQRKEKPEEIGSMAKISSYLMTEMKTMADKSVSHMADMMIQGNTMGMTAIIRNMREHEDAEIGAISLAEKFLATAEHNVSEMKKFL